MILFQLLEAQFSSTLPGWYETCLTGSIRMPDNRTLNWDSGGRDGQPGVG